VASAKLAIINETTMQAAGESSRHQRTPTRFPEQLRLSHPAQAVTHTMLANNANLAMLGR
jgi:hypothetical protein